MLRQAQHDDRDFAKMPINKKAIRSLESGRPFHLKPGLAYAHHNLAEVRAAAHVSEGIGHFIKIKYLANDRL
jgi:hypothetical protein